MIRFEDIYLRETLTCINIKGDIKGFLFIQTKTGFSLSECMIKKIKINSEPLFTYSIFWKMWMVNIDPLPLQLQIK